MVSSSVAVSRTTWWLVAAGTYGAILATAAVGPDVVDELRRQGALDALFGVGAALVALTILLRTARPNRHAVAITVGLVGVGVLVGVRFVGDVERTHLVEYAVLATAVDGALATWHGRSGAVRHWSAWLLTSALGAVDEAVQAALPRRVFDVRDIVFNAVAAATAIAVPVIAGRLAGSVQARRVGPSRSSRSR